MRPGVSVFIPWYIPIAQKGAWHVVDSWYGFVVWMASHDFRLYIQSGSRSEDEGGARKQYIWITWRIRTLKSHDKSVSKNQGKE